MKKYPKYKDSGVEWIGEIPEDWDTTQIKFLAKIQNGSTPNSSTDEYWDGNVNWVTTDDLGKLENKFIKKTRRTITELGYKSCGTTLAPVGSVVISTRAPIGHLGILNIEACSNQGCKTLIPNKINSLFCYFFLSISKEILNSMGQGSTFKELPTTTLKDFKIAIPKSQKEQTQIANYLDFKTKQIETLISNKEKLIELLKEERTAIINQAVTKGINPDVPMKDSGIEWLGEIPRHWTQSRIKYTCEIIGRIGFRGYTTADLVEKGEGAISLSPSNIKNQTLDIGECTYLSWDKYNESPEIKIYSGDIIIVKTGSTIGKVALVPENQPEMTLNPQLVVMKNIRINSRFLYYSMVSDYFQAYFEIYSAGGSTPAISQEKINNFQIAFPSIEEQIEIANHIDSRKLKLQVLEKQYLSEIELLKEYKTALISEVVTGKVDVRDEKLN